MRSIASLCIIIAASFSAALFLLTDLESRRCAREAVDQLLPAERLLYSAGFELLRTRDPQTGRIPEGMRSREMAFAATLPTVTSAANSLRKTQGAGFIAGWKRRGPDRVAGRMLDLRFDRDDENTLYSGAASGGFWKSDDRGTTWRRTTPPELQQTVNCIVQDPRPGRGDVLYYGTGELLSTTDRSIDTTPRTTGLGNGIYRSADRGEHWTPLTSTLVSAAGELQSPFQGVWDLEIAYDGWDAGTLYAACYGQILRSSDDGASWETVLGDPAAPSFCTDIAITPVLSFAALGGFSVTPSTPAQRGVFYSTDRRDWIDITPLGFPADARMVKLAIAPSNPYILYVVTERPEPYSNQQLAFTSSSHTLWKYTHDPSSGTGNWEERTSSLPGGGIGNAGNNGFNSLGGYCLTMAVYPEDADMLFLGGTSLYRSSDAFQTGRNIVLTGGYPYSWTERELHPDQHALAFLPSDPSRLFVSNDGGVQSTTNCLSGDVTWALHNDGLVTSQFYRVAQDPADIGDAFLIGGLQDNATYYNYDGSDPVNWNGVIGGDGMSVAVAPNKDFVLASVYNGRMYSFTLSSGMEAENLTYQTGSQLPTNRFAFFTVFTLDPFNGKTLYLGGVRTLWRKNDISISAHDDTRVNEGWQEIQSAEFPIEDYVSAIGCAADASGRMYIGSSGGSILRIDDARGAAPTATELKSVAFPAGAYVSCIAVDPRDADRLFAVFSNYNVQSVFLSTDGGASWASVSGNLEEHPDGSGAGPSVRWLAILPVGSGEMLFAATSSGLYSTTLLEGMQTQWLRESPDGIGGLCVDHVDARAVDGSVIVATQGGGVWSANVEGVNGIVPAAAAGNFALLTAWPQPMQSRVQLQLQRDRAAALDLVIRNMEGREMLRERRFAGAGKSSYTFDVHSFPPGVYFFTADDGTQSRTTKLMKLNP